MKRIICICLITLFFSQPGETKKVPDFIAQQCGGGETKFKLSEHSGSWILLDFLLPAETEEERSHYLEYEKNLDRLVYGTRILPVFFRSNNVEETAAWWGGLPSNRLPIFRDPGGRLAQALKIPMGMKVGEKTTHYPCVILVDPKGNEVWRKMSKVPSERVSVEDVLTQVSRIIEEQAAQELKIKEAKKMAQDENTITTDSGLKYIDHVVGDGESPQNGDTVVVHYTGTLENGKKFDSSVDRNQPFEFPIGVGRVIKGWDEGVMSMKIGGKRKLIIPSDLGYGAGGAGGSIPPNATLIFEVELLGIK